MIKPAQKVFRKFIETIGKSFGLLFLLTLVVSADEGRNSPKNHNRACNEFLRIVLSEEHSAPPRTGKVRQSNNKTILTAPDRNLRGAAIITTNGIESTAHELQKVSPSAGVGFEYFLLPSGPLGPGGVLGAVGPLGEMGPVGNNLWNPSYWISNSVHGKPFEEWSKLPLGVLGPFGKEGPFNKYFYEVFLPSIAPHYSAHLEEGGMLMALGSKGPAGPYGLFGDLGPLGAHGYRVDTKTGRYLDANSNEIRSISLVDETGKTREHALIELYADHYTDHLSDSHQLNSSFAVDSGISKSGGVRDYNVKLKEGTWVNFVAVPLTFSDHFSVQLLTKTGEVVATADSKSLINFISMKVAHNADLIVRVRESSAFPFKTGRYRLIVTDAPSVKEDLGFDGPYLIHLK